MVCGVCLIHLLRGYFVYSITTEHRIFIAQRVWAFRNIRVVSISMYSAGNAKAPCVDEFMNKTHFCARTHIHDEKGAHFTAKWGCYIVEVNE